MKKIVIIAAGIVLLAAGCGTQKQSSTSSENSKKKQWLTYKSQVLGYELQYPAEIKPSEDNPDTLNEGFIYWGENMGVTILSVMVYPDAGKIYSSLDSYIQENYDPKKAVLQIRPWCRYSGNSGTVEGEFKSEEITFHGMPAKQLACRANVDGKEILDEAIVFKNGDDIYVIKENRNPQAMGQLDAAKTIDGMLDSFKLFPIDMKPPVAEPSDWLLVNGDYDTCYNPVYKGDVEAYAWHTRKKGVVYDSQNEEVMVLAMRPQDWKKLPIVGNVKIPGWSPYFFDDTQDSNLEKLLNTSTAANPTRVRITGIASYCEGLPYVRLEPVK